MSGRIRDNLEHENIHFAYITHRVGLNGERTYFDIYFTVDSFTGEPYIAEPEKVRDCSGLQSTDFQMI